MSKNVISRRKFILLTPAVAAATLAACAAPPAAAPAKPAAPAAEAPKATEAPAAAAPAAAPAMDGMDWYTKAAEKYKGVTLKGVTEASQSSKYAAKQLAESFEKLTGIKIDLETTSWDQQYDKAIKDMEAQTGIYDFVYVEQDIIYAYLKNNYLTNLTKYLKDNPTLAAPGFKVDNFTTFINYFKDANGDIYGTPMEAFLKIYVFRKDLFDDKAVQEAFKKKSGKDLKPATTHAEYQEIADFFTEWGKDKELWGTTVQAANGHSSSFYEFFESIAPTFGVYNWGINDKFKATGGMNGDKAKAALKYWVGLLKDAPPESSKSTWDEVATTMAAGRAAQGLVYGENVAWIASDASRSKVIGKIGVALPPTEPGVIDEAKAGKGYIGYYDGGAYGMPATAKNKEAAALWLQYLGEPSIQPDWAANAARITESATYADPKVADMNTKTNGYFDMMKNDGPLFAGAPPFPFHAQIQTVAAPFIWKALAGELTPDAALDQAAAAVDAELVKLGYAK